VKLIRVLDKSRTLDVFKRLKLTEQAQVLRAMERNEAVRLLEELDPQLRARLADAIPAKPNRRPLVPLKLQAVWSIFA
jgi:Mg/Co/Ni transporter MgtE